PWLLRAVGEPLGVAEVDEVLLRQGDQALVQHGEATHAGIEHRDGERTIELGRRGGQDRQGWTTMKKIAIATISPAIFPPVSGRFGTPAYSAPRVSPAARSRSASLSARCVFGRKNPCAIPNRTKIAMNPIVTQDSPADISASISM